MRMLKFKLIAGMNRIPIAENLQAKLRYINDQDGKIMGWFEVTHNAEPELPAHEYEVYLATTGESVPDLYNYVCSHQVHQGGGYFVIHAFD